MDSASFPIVFDFQSEHPVELSEVSDCKACALRTIQDTAVCCGSQSSGHRASHPMVRSQASHMTISDDRHIIMCVGRRSATTGQSCDPLHGVSDRGLSG